MNNTDHRLSLAGLRIVAAFLLLAAAPERAGGDHPIALLRCLDAQGVALISAHRGGPAPGYPENAIATFARVARLGPVVLETDVRQSQDGTLLLMHDDTLDRTTTGRGRVSETSWNQIAGLRLRDPRGAETPYRVPSLAAALDWLSGWTESEVIVQLDVKRGVPMAAVVKAVARAGAADRVILITYSVDQAEAVLAMAPDIAVSLSIDSADDLARLRRRGLDLDRVMAWTGVGDPDPALWRALDTAGLPVAFGTMWDLDDQIADSGRPGRYRGFVDKGVDVLATDRPLAAHRAIDQGQASRRAARQCRPD